MAATTLLSTLLAKSPKASSLGSFTAPTAEEGRVIPVVMGTVQLQVPNVTWYGDLKARPIIVGGLPWLLGGLLHLLMPGKKVGYKYSMGMQMVLCHGPVDALVGLGYVENQSGVHVGDGQVIGITVPPGLHKQTFTVAALNPPTSFSLVGSITGSTGSHAVVGVPFFDSQVALSIVHGPTTPFHIGVQFI